MKLKYVLFAGLTALLIGCNKAPAVTESGTGAKDKGGATADATGDQTVTTPSVDSIPAELKNNAYDYYGLGNTKALDMEFVQSDSGTVLTGSQANVLKSVDKDGAMFTIERTGGLAQIGSSTIKLKADGVYIEEVMGTKASGKEVELPTDLTEGKTWTSSMNFSNGPNSMDVTCINTVKGIVKFKTKVGEREGVLITLTGRGKMNGEDIQLDGKNWYVKGIGGVKSELTTTYKKTGKKKSVTLEETKLG